MLASARSQRRSGFLSPVFASSIIRSGDQLDERIFPIRQSEGHPRQFERETHETPGLGVGPKAVHKLGDGHWRSAACAGGSARKRLSATDAWRRAAVSDGW